MTDEFRSPPEIKKVTVDHSVFHPLDHWPWRCGSLPGGWRRHLRYTWEYRRRSQLRAATLCRLGFHENVQWWQRDRATEVQMTWTGCMNCGKPSSRKQPA
jgi:hypothetical protein